jgi:hypothetical protein
MSGISVLHLSLNNIREEQEAADPYRLVLSLLAAITELRSRGISEIAIIIRSAATAQIPLQEIESQLFARCIAASLGPSATWEDMTEQLIGLTETIRSAVDSIRGITFLPTLPEEREAASRGAAQHVEMAYSAVAGAKDAQIISDTLYHWTLATLNYTPALAVTHRRELVDPSPSKHSLGIALSSQLRAEAAQARTLMQENLHYLQQQWDAMLADLEVRDANRASRVRTRLAIAVVPSDGSLVKSTTALRAARLTWHLLDKPARYRWLDAWNQVLPVQGLHTSPSP